MLPALVVVVYSETRHEPDILVMDRPVLTYVRLSCNIRASNGVGAAAVAVVDFWYSIGSTYTYLSVMRLADVARSSGVSFRWRPFNVRHIMIQQNNIPFKDKPVKTAYMWRDVERRAHQYGLLPKIPAPYPLPGLVLANQIAVLGAAEGWVESYTRATYRRRFEGGEPAGEEPNIAGSLREAGQDPGRVLELAQAAPIVKALSDATDEAMALGVFGSPTFVVAGEVFWGDDRLEDAIRWADGQRGAPQPDH